MAVTITNTKLNGSNASASSQTCNWSASFTATAGRLLLIGINSPPGTSTFSGEDAGWVKISDNTAAARTFSTAWYYKVAVGGETSFTLSLSAANSLQWVVVELSGLAITSVFDASAENETYNNSSTKTLDTGTTAMLSVSDGFAVAFMATDQGTGWDLNRSLSDDYTEIGYNSLSTGLALAYKQLSSSAGATTTWSTTDSGEQTYAAIAVFKLLAGGGVTGTIGITLESVITAFSGTTTVLGSIASTLGEATTALTGTTTVTGSIANTLGDATTVLDGDVGQTGPVGDIASNLGDSTASLMGTTAVVGTIGTTLEDSTTALTGTTTIVGTIANTLDDVVTFLYGFPGVQGLVAKLRTLIGTGT